MWPASLLVLPFTPHTNALSTLRKDSPVLTPSHSQTGSAVEQSLWKWLQTERFRDILEKPVSLVAKTRYVTVAQEQRRRTRNTAKRGGSGIALELAGALPQEALLKPGNRHPAELTLLLPASGRPPNFARETQRAAQCGMTFVGASGTPPATLHTHTHISLLATCIDLLSTGHLDTWGANDDLSTHQSVSKQGNSQVYTCYKSLRALLQSP